MNLSEEGCLLRIFVGESDKKDDVPLYVWIIRRAKEEGLAGATAWRGIEGYGAHSHIHTSRILQLSTDLPVVIEIVDTVEKIEKFLPIVDSNLQKGLATIEKVKVHLYRAHG